MSKSNGKEPSTVIETFIKRFREQLPSSSETRKAVLPRESFWWLDKPIDKSNADNKTSYSMNEKKNKIKKSHRYDDEDENIVDNNNDNNYEDEEGEEYENDSQDEYIEDKNNLISKPKIDVSFDQPSNYKKKIISSVDNKKTNYNNNNNNNNNNKINENKIFQKHVENDFVGYLPKDSMDLSVFADMTSSYTSDDNDITETKDLDDYASKLLNQCDNLLESYEGHKLTGYLNMNKTKKITKKDNIIINESSDDVSYKSDSINISNYTNNDISLNNSESNIIKLPPSHELKINENNNLNKNDTKINDKNKKTIEIVENKNNVNEKDYIIRNNNKSLKNLDSVDSSGIFCFLSSSFERDNENDIEVTVSSIKSTTELDKSNIDNSLISLISPISSTNSLPISNTFIPNISSRKEYLKYMENEVKLLLQSVSNTPEQDNNKSLNLDSLIIPLKIGDEIQNNKIVNEDINDLNLSSTTNNDISNNDNNNTNLLDNQNSSNIIEENNVSKDNDIKHIEEIIVINEVDKALNEVIHTDKIINYENNKEINEIKLKTNTNFGSLVLTDVEDYLYDNQIQILWSRLLKVRKDLNSFK